MKEHGRFWCKAVIFIVILGVLCHLTNQVLTPKYYADEDWPTTATYLGFYQMKRNTVDVLFLGSSHAVAAFSPQELYNQTGIRSYNLGCEQQNVITSYYWLKEALQYQNPKVVILETRMLFDFFEDEPLNTTEECTRKAFDFMKWSKVKLEAVIDLCSIDKSQSLSSYFLPNIRYHERWKSLQKEDFDNSWQNHFELKGQGIMKWSSSGDDYAPFQIQSNQESEEMNPLMKEYLERITELCQEKKIPLILVKTPAEAQKVEMYHTLAEYAQNHALRYVDFNEETLYNEIGYVWSKDNADKDHLSCSGAKKIAKYLGEVLMSEYGLTDRPDDQWESTKEYYEDVIKEYL